MAMKHFQPKRPNASKRLKEIEEMRASLPLGKYLQLIHIGATTGVIPKINPLTGDPVMISLKIDADDPENHTGKPTTILQMEGSRLEPQHRLSLLQYLVDKQMPNMSSMALTEANAEKPSNQVIEDPSVVPHLTTEELDDVISDAEFYVPKLSLPPTPKSDVG